jgi:hypothetical protein
LDYYRIPEEFLSGVTFTRDPANSTSGSFQSVGVAPGVPVFSSFEPSKYTQVDISAIQLPYDFTELIENLRLERYRAENLKGLEGFTSSEAIRKLYYFSRDFLPFRIRRQLQKIYFQDWEQLTFPDWPVDTTVDRLHRRILRLTMEAAGIKKLPFIWFWPNAALSCLLLTHDVETSAGRDFTFKLMDLDDSYGFKAAYQVIPEQRYEVPDEYVATIRARGCEFNIHDLNHDGHLYSERREFARRAARINDYSRHYKSQGFRAGAMYRRQEWYDVFDFSYDMSVPNVAHLEPLRGGCCTVMPYFIGRILEIPLTTVEDYSLFHILNDYSIGLWKKQCALIRGGSGLMSFLAHPDYLIERRARKVYESLLDYLRKMITEKQIWSTLPGDVDLWWRARRQMRLVRRGGDWEIEGPERKRASVAYAVIDGDQFFYECAGNPVEKVEADC